MRALPNNDLRGIKQLSFNYRLEYAVGPDPHVGTVVDAFPLELEGSSVPHIVADIFLVDQNLMDGSPRPNPSEVGPDAACIEKVGDFALELPFFDERPVDPADGVLFLRWTSH